MKVRDQATSRSESTTWIEEQICPTPSRNNLSVLGENRLQNPSRGTSYRNNPAATRQVSSDALGSLFTNLVVLCFHAMIFDPLHSDR